MTEQEARQAERDAIVAWLRRLGAEESAKAHFNTGMGGQADPQRLSLSKAHFWYADAIERGNHLDQ